MQTWRTLGSLIAARTGQSVGLAVEQLLQSLSVALQRENGRAVLRRMPCTGRLLTCCRFPKPETSPSISGTSISAFHSSFLGKFLFDLRLTEPGAGAAAPCGAGARSPEITFRLTEPGGGIAAPCGAGAFSLSFMSPARTGGRRSRTLCCRGLSFGWVFSPRALRDTVFPSLCN